VKNVPYRRYHELSSKRGCLIPVAYCGVEGAGKMAAESGGANPRQQISQTCGKARFDLTSIRRTAVKVGG
jgi:hypothetical protein